MLPNSYPDDLYDPYSVGVTAPGVTAPGPASFDLGRRGPTTIGEYDLGGRTAPQSLGGELVATFTDPSNIPGYAVTAAKALAAKTLGGPAAWGLTGVLALARADPTRAGFWGRLVDQNLVPRSMLRKLGILSTPQAEAAFGGYGTAEAETEGVAGIDTSGKTAYGGGEFSMGDDWSGPTTVDTATDYGYGVQDQTDAEEGQAAADAEEDEESGFGESSDWNTGGFVQMMPPQGIPQRAIDSFRSKPPLNAGISAFFPTGIVPDFMDRVLRPRSAVT